MDLEKLLGDEADSLLGHRAKAFPSEHLILPGPDYLDGVFTDTDRSPTVLRNLGTAVQPRAAGRHRVPLHPPGRPGHRALGRRQLLQEPGLLRPGQPARAGPRRRLQRRRHHAGHARAWCRGATCTGSPSSSSSTTTSSCTTRTPTTRSCSARSSRRPTWAPSASAPPSTSAPTTPTASSARCRRRSPRRTGWACSPCCGATCATPPSRRTASTTSCPPTSPARPTTWASRSRPTSSSRSSRRTTAATTPSGSAGPTRWSTSELTTDNPIDLTRWQVVNCYAGRIGLINSGGESKGDNDLAQAVRTAVINKRAGGMGLIVGRKAFQRPMAEGAALIHAIQDVYLDDRGHHRLTVASVAAMARADPNGRRRPRASRPVSGSATWRGESVPIDCHRVREMGASARSTRIGATGLAPSTRPATGRSETGAQRADEEEPGLTSTTERPSAEAARPGHRAVRRRLGRRHAAHRGPLHDARALLGNDMSTFPDFPAEIRAPAGTLNGVSAFQVHISDHDILTPGDSPNVLVAMNPAALKANIDTDGQGDHPPRQQRRLRGAQPGQGRLRRQPADRRLAGRLHRLRGADDLHHPGGVQGGRGQAPRRRALQELLRPGAGELALHPADRPTMANGSPSGSAPSPRWPRPTPGPSGPAIDFGETAELFESNYEVGPATFEPGEYVQVTGNRPLAWGLITAARLAGCRCSSAATRSPRPRTSCTS